MDELSLTVTMLVVSMALGSMLHILLAQPTVEMRGRI